MASIKQGNIEFESGDETIRYNYLQQGETTKILGLHITRCSWTAQHAIKTAKKANKIISYLYAVRGFSTRNKLYLIKTLVIPILLYPCVPLNASSIATIATLQTVLNRALRFAFGVRYPDMPTARSLHIRAKIKPINIMLYKRAKNLWAKLESGHAGDRNTFEDIIGTPIEKPHTWFPSSYTRAQKPEPPPMYTRQEGSSPQLVAYYN